MNLQPCLLAACVGYLGTDTRPESPSEIEALASHIASDLCNSCGDLAAVRKEIGLLLAEDHAAMVALGQACSFDWLQHPSEHAALKRVLSESSTALNLRMAWENNS